MGLSHTVSGDIASFRTPSRVPIESLKFHFLPKQEGSGDPSPINIRPITGWTGLNGRRSHKNLIKPYYTGTVTQRGITVTPTDNGVRVTGTASIEHPVRLSVQDIRRLEYGKKYTFSLYLVGDISGCKDPYLGYHDGTVYRSIGNLTQENNYKLTWTVPDRYANVDAPWFDMYIRVKEGSTVDFEIGLQMEAGENATSYEPYSGEQIPITFPNDETIYGGYIDPVRGKLVAEWETYTFTGEETDLIQNYRASGGTRLLLVFAHAGIQYGENGGVISNILRTTNNAHGDNVCYPRPSSQGCIIDLGRSTICDLTAEEFDALTNNEQVALGKTYIANLYSNGTPLIIAYKLVDPVEYDIDPIPLRAFLDHSNFWSDANDVTEVTYAVTESKDILAIRKKAQSFNDYFQGELVFELNGDDPPVDGAWVERVNGWGFELLGDASYDSVNKVYDFSGRSLAATSNENAAKLNMGHHFRIEWDLYYKRKLSNSSIFFDIGSLTSADKALGIGLLTKSDNSTISFNWKMLGNSSSPWSGVEEIRESPVVIPMDDVFTHLTGFHEIIPSNDGYDRARVKVNNKIKKYITPVPKVLYSGPWSSQIKPISIGAGVYNIAALRRGSTGDDSYYCECKIKSIKIYKYD